MNSPELSNESPEQNTPARWSWPGAAFFPIGIVFIVLGLSGNTAFLGIGVVFFILSIAMFNQTKERLEEGAADAEIAPDGPDASADSEGEPRDG